MLNKARSENIGDMGVFEASLRLCLMMFHHVSSFPGSLFFFFVCFLPVAPETQESHAKRWKTIKNEGKLRKNKSNWKNRKNMTNNEQKWKIKKQKWFPILGPPKVKNVSWTKPGLKTLGKIVFSKFFSDYVSWYFWKLDLRLHNQTLVSFPSPPPFFFTPPS